MIEEGSKINLTNNSEFIYMSYHAIEEAKSWTKILKYTLDEKMFIQAAFLSIYASELYLKGLLMVLGVNALGECKGNNGHILHILFQKLPDKNLKYSIANNVVFRCKSMQKKFDNREKLLKYFEKQIEKISSSYNQYRYLYEKYINNTTISIPIEFILNLTFILEKECDLISYEKTNVYGDIVDVPDPKYSYHIIGKGWVENIDSI